MMGKIEHPRLKKLTQKQKENITLYVLKGYTLAEIAELYGVRYAIVVRYFKWEKEISNITSIQMYCKTVPYYEDEDDYGRIPSYKVSELNEEELKIYNDLERGKIKIKRIRR